MKQKATDDQIIKACGKKGKKAGVLASQLGLGIEQMRNRLRALVKEGRILKQGVGSPVSSPTYKAA